MLRAIRETTSALFQPGVDQIHRSGSCPIAVSSVVVDRHPILFWDRRDRVVDLGDEPDGDRPANIGTVEFVDEFPGPEPRIGPDGDRPRNSGAADRGEELSDEPDHPA